MRTGFAGLSWEESARVNDSVDGEIGNSAEGVVKRCDEVRRSRDPEPKYCGANELASFTSIHSQLTSAE
eukprot:scaffold994_cov226-Prasinococcus_capsulatus_cf.AAC.22